MNLCKGIAYLGHACARPGRRAIDRSGGISTLASPTLGAGMAMPACMARPYIPSPALRGLAWVAHSRQLAPTAWRHRSHLAAAARIRAHRTGDDP